MMDRYVGALRAADAIVARHGYDVHAVPHPVRVVYLVGQLEFELVGGGVAQWLSNRSGRYAGATVAALREIGAEACACIVERMIVPIGPEERLDDDAWRADVVRLAPIDVVGAWRSLADDLLEWPDDVDALLRRYVAANEAAFAGAPGTVPS